MEIGMMKILWLLLVIMSLAPLLNFGVFKKAMKEVEKLYIVELLISMFRTILGLVIVLFFNVWTGPYLLVTVVWWLSLGIGVAGLLLPHQIMDALPMMTKKPAVLKALLVLTLALGLVMTYFGFFA